MVKFLGHWMSLDCNRVFTRSAEPHDPMREREVNTYLRKKRDAESFIRNGAGVICFDRLSYDEDLDIRRPEDVMGRLTQ